MKLHALFESFSSEVINDLDSFFASPRMTLKPSTIADLKKRFPGSGDVTLYRVLFSYNEEETAKQLGVDKLVPGKATHKANRVSSWSTSQDTVREMAEENSDLGDFYIILEATISREHVVLDTTRLSNTELLALRDNNPNLVRLVRDQKEVIVDAGSYPCTILSIEKY